MHELIVRVVCLSSSSFSQPLKKSMLPKGLCFIANSFLSVVALFIAFS